MSRLIKACKTAWLSNYVDDLDENNPWQTPIARGLTYMAIAYWRMFLIAVALLVYAEATGWRFK